jgi:hypothetical protein
MTTSFQEPSVNINPAEGYDSSTSPEIPQRKKLLVRLVEREHFVVLGLLEQRIQGGRRSNSLIVQKAATSHILSHFRIASAAQASLDW